MKETSLKYLRIFLYSHDTQPIQQLHKVQLSHPFKSKAVFKQQKS